MVQQMEAQGQGDLAVVLQRNLMISWGLCMVDTLLLVLHVRDVEQAVVYSTLPQEYSTLTFEGRGCCCKWESGREKQSDLLA